MMCFLRSPRCAVCLFLVCTHHGATYNSKQVYLLRTFTAVALRHEASQLVLLGLVLEKNFTFTSLDFSAF
jgi:hypothetical protein